MRKIPFAGVKLTSQRVRGLRGTSELPGRPATVHSFILQLFGAMPKRGRLHQKEDAYSVCPGGFTRWMFGLWFSLTVHGLQIGAPPYAIGSVLSLSGHAIAYRWRSLPRVRRNRASKPQGSSERVLPWQVTMDQLICASLSHTHRWYEVGMLKV